jgi:uncharacterized membrane protein
MHRSSLIAALCLSACTGQRPADNATEASTETGPVQQAGAAPATRKNEPGEAATEIATPAEVPVVAAEPNSSPAAGACATQDGKALPRVQLRAVGTEPFWAARIDGRCVTYSHPDDQEGTRVWTRFKGTEGSGLWTGALGGQPFVVRTRPEADCSDGMSDRRYPIAVTLTVMGEERQGCAYRA